MSDFEPLPKIAETLVTKLTEKALKSFIKFCKSTFAESSSDSSYNSFENQIMLQFNEMYKWCQEIEFIKISEPLKTFEKTIDLEFFFSLKIDDESNGNRLFSETDILQTPANAIIEGGPGSGKTTTLKRLLSHNFFNLCTNDNIYNYPLLIRFRDIDEDYDLYTYICHLLAIKYNTEVRQSSIKNTGFVNPLKNRDFMEFSTKETLVNRINGIDLDIYIADLLDKNKVLLVMDGFDELKPALFDKIKKQIKELCLRLKDGKLLITSRPNHIKINLTNTNCYQVKELTTQQIKSITGRWIKDNLSFFNQLKNKSYFELANRPLFLTFLIILYKEQHHLSYKSLPKLSREVYVRLVDLLVIKWDQDRDVERITKYSYFDSFKKVEFLSKFAFHLTYVIKQKTFTHEDFVTVYLQIHQEFDLPPDEASLVAEEIESHTGIIVKSFYNKFEFSHLALQEYLCAKVIVTSYIDENVKLYFIEYPPPLALAVSLSSNPSTWFFALITSCCRAITDWTKRTETCTQILDRLYIESPHFTNIPQLGVAIMYMCKYCNCVNVDFANTLERLILQNNNIRLSILNVLTYYNKKGSFRGSIVFHRKEGSHSMQDIYFDELCLPENCSILNEL